jgi:threonine/homoserine/homoserine lactone efflux protein
MTLLMAFMSSRLRSSLAIPGLGSVLLWVPAPYILWLAYRIAIAPPAVGAGRPREGRLSFAGGTLLGAANPKSWVAIGAASASAHLADTTTADVVAKTARC